MAEEVKKIITIEVGKSITSVRDFKKHIEDLRGALLGLNEESDEYKTIAEQIATDQAKLNDVMKVGKTNTDSAAGSYNELNNQLKALRNQYKALSETERNSTTGQSILQNITKLDTQLKDIDASMGQYQRNVGNYKQAFEGAFQLVLGEIGKVNPQLGTLISTVQKLVPLFRGVGTAATAAGTSIKAAMASTGIGLLVVALGEVIAHWDTISEKIRNVLGLQDNYIRSIQRTTDEIKNLKTQIESIDFSFIDSAAAAAGLNTLEKYQARFNLMESSINTIQSLNQNILGGLYQVKEAKENIDKQNVGSYETNLKMIKDILDNYQETAGVYIELSNEEKSIIKSLQKDLDDAIAVANDYTYVSQDMAWKTVDAVSDFFSKELQENQKRADSVLKQWDQVIQQRNEAITIEKLGYEQRAKNAENFNKTEEQILLEELEREKAYVMLITEEGEDRNRILVGLENEYQNKIKKARENAWKSSDAYKEREERLSQAKSLYKSLLDYGKDEVQLVEDKYQEELVLLQQFGYDTTNLTNKYLDDIQKAIQNKSDDIDSLIQQIADEIKKTWEDAFKLDLQKINDEETAALHQADMMWTINPNTHESDIQLEREKEDRIYEIQKEGYYKRIQLYEEHLLLLEQGSDEYLDLERQITEAKMDLDDLGYNHAVELEQRKREDIQLTLQKWQQAVNFAQSTVSIFGTIAGDIANYTLEYAEEGTKAYKAAQITQAIISTLNGMVGVFSQALSAYGLPWGAVVGAAGATLMGTVGAMRINQIRNANANTSISGGSSSVSTGVGVAPLLNQDYDLQRITNLSLQSDAYLPGNTQVYVLESDIQEVGRRVEVREQNATF